MRKKFEKLSVSETFTLPALTSHEFTEATITSGMLEQKNVTPLPVQAFTEPLDLRAKTVTKDFDRMAVDNSALNTVVLFGKKQTQGGVGKAEHHFEFAERCDTKTTKLVGMNAYIFMAVNGLDTTSAINQYRTKHLHVMISPVVVLTWQSMG
jgi:hypothetical protein